MLDQWCCLDSSIAQHGKSVSQLTDSTLISLYMVNMLQLVEECYLYWWSDCVNNLVKNSCLLCFKGSPLKKCFIRNTSSDRSGLVKPLIFHKTLDKYIMVFLFIEKKYQNVLSSNYTIEARCSLDFFSGYLQEFRIQLATCCLSVRDLCVFKREMGGPDSWKQNLSLGLGWIHGSIYFLLEMCSWKVWPYLCHLRLFFSLMTMTILKTLNHYTRLNDKLCDNFYLRKRTILEKIPWPEAELFQESSVLQLLVVCGGVHSLTPALQSCSWGWIKGYEAFIFVWE